MSIFGKQEPQDGNSLFSLAQTSLAFATVLSVSAGKFLRWLVSSGTTHLYSAVLAMGVQDDLEMTALEFVPHLIKPANKQQFQFRIASWGGGILWKPP